MRHILLFLITILSFSNIHAQNWALERSVMVSADVQSSPPTITLNWESEPAVSFQIFRRLKGATAWGFAVATINYPEMSYTDTDVEVGVSYEYKIEKNDVIKGEGTINTGIEIEAVEQRGKLILIADNTHTTALEMEISRLISDIQGDGWAVEYIEVSPTASVTSVKDEIEAIYDADPTNVKAVLLLGHIPVPYSGLIFPDGHEDHEGAWPADLYYGEMNGNWTDQSINNTAAADSRNHNVPGDGKFDQSGIPNDIELQVGRIDFHNLPAFAESETTLLQNYLNKHHAFRHKEFTMPQRGLLENNFGGLPEGFAQSAYRNFANMFGADEVYEEDFTTLNTEGYLWSYGCGAGSYTSCNNVTTTAALAADSLHTVFSMLFGSYFGDWDTENNLLRSALASGYTLTNAWAGRPKWQFQHMAMGENIGYGTLLTQNTATNWFVDTCFGGRLVHIALMGDPTLRMHIVDPAANLTVVEDNATAMLSWDASTDDVLGYHVYRKVAGDDYFERLNDDLLTTTSYEDPCLIYQTNYEYMVRAMRLETSASGSYYNLSQGLMNNLTVATDITIAAAFDVDINSSIVEFTNLSNNGNSYLWDFGDGSSSTEPNPTHVYNSTGTYNVSLTVTNDCFVEVIFMDVTILQVGVEEVLPGVSLSVNPIPVNEYLNVAIESNHNTTYQLSLIDMTGKVLMETSLNGGASKRLERGDLSAGLYLLQVQDAEGNKGTSKVVLQ